MTFPAVPEALAGSSGRRGRFAIFCSERCPAPCPRPRLEDKEGSALGGKLPLPFQNCVPLFPLGHHISGSGTKNLSRFKDGRLSSVELASGGGSTCRRDPLSLGVPPCCASHLLWRLGSGPDFSHDTGVGGRKPHFCVLQPLNSLGPAQRRLCAALAELVTGAAAKQVVVTALLGVLLACWERPSSCLERRVEPAWLAWVLQEPQALLDPEAKHVFGILEQGLAHRRPRRGIC